ncbi:MAG: prepilin-type N-terminal cleavage/methylation domain-containing protein [Elusimicrobiaceae bacterium]|nr:prepilin-type N-terminal cleavage/methylation domain-containing protein [Elusimicrobiaceae bacterium]
MKIFTKNKQGFTLAELMAVVMIVAILAGIAIGAYHKAIERAQFNEGLSVSNAIMAASDQYFYDFNANPASINDLSLDIRGTKSGLTLKTDKFIFTLVPGHYVTANRTGGNYSIKVLTSLNNTGAVTCSQTAAGGLDFCKSVGY